MRALVAGLRTTLNLAMPGKVKVAAGHSPEWHRIDFRMDAKDALPLVYENIAEIASTIDEAADAGCVMAAFAEDTLGLTGWLSHHFDDQKSLLAPAVERMPAAYAILTDPNPPALAKFAHMPIPSGDEASRLGAEVLTTGAERLSAADKLVKAGKRDEAIAEFEAMSAYFKTTWIGRASRKRLRELQG